jgi:hypothetical protein
MELEEVSGIAKRTLERARRGMGVKTKKSGRRVDDVYNPSTPPTSPSPPSGGGVENLAVTGFSS